MGRGRAGDRPVAERKRQVRKAVESDAEKTLSISYSAFTKPVKGRPMTDSSDKEKGSWQRPERNLFWFAQAILTCAGEWADEWEVRNISALL